MAKAIALSRLGESRPFISQTAPSHITSPDRAAQKDYGNDEFFYTWAYEADSDGFNGWGAEPAAMATGSTGPCLR